MIDKKLVPISCGKKWENLIPNELTETLGKRFCGDCHKLVQPDAQGTRLDPTKVNDKLYVNIEIGDTPCVYGWEYTRKRIIAMEAKKLPRNRA
jgi:hypothetical protein